MNEYSCRLQARDDPDFRTFIAIDSETDDLPIGRVRQHWASDALEKKDIIIEQAECLYRDQAIEAAQNLIKKYDSTIEEIE